MTSSERSFLYGDTSADKKHELSQISSSPMKNWGNALGLTKAQIEGLALLGLAPKS